MAQTFDFPAGISWTVSSLQKVKEIHILGDTQRSYSALISAPKQSPIIGRNSDPHKCIPEHKIRILHQCLFC